MRLRARTAPRAPAGRVGTSAEGMPPPACGTIKRRRARRARAHLAGQQRAGVDGLALREEVGVRLGGRLLGREPLHGAALGRHGEAHAHLDLGARRQRRRQRQLQRPAQHLRGARARGALLGLTCLEGARAQQPQGDPGRAEHHGRACVRAWIACVRGPVWTPRHGRSPPPRAPHRCPGRLGILLLCEGGMGRRRAGAPCALGPRRRRGVWGRRRRWPPGAPSGRPGRCSCPAPAAGRLPPPPPLNTAAER